MIIDVTDKINGKVYTINLNHIVYFDKILNAYNVYHYNIHLVDGTIITLTHKAWNKLKNSIKKVN